MARITVEDCLTKETNRFALVQLAAKRTKQLLHGTKSSLSEKYDNKSVVMALREIADGRVRFMSEEELRIAAELEAEQRAAQLSAPVVPTPLPMPAIAEDGAPASSGTNGESSSEIPGLNGDNSF